MLLGHLQGVCLEMQVHSLSPRFRCLAKYGQQRGVQLCSGVRQELALEEPRESLCPRVLGKGDCWGKRVQSAGELSAPHPVVGVSEVSRGERRADSRRGSGGLEYKSLSHALTWPLMDLLYLWAPDTPLDLQRSNLPSSRVCLVGQARVCPLGKPGDDPGGAKEAGVQLLWLIHCPSGLHWGCWAFSPPWERDPVRDTGQAWRLELANT